MLSLAELPITDESSNVSWQILMLSLQAKVCGCISAHPGLPHQNTNRETSDA